MKLSRKLAALAMAVLLAVSLTACSPKQVAQDMVVHLVHKLGLVEESDEDDTDTTTKAPAGGSVEFPCRDGHHRGPRCDLPGREHAVCLF